MSSFGDAGLQACEQKRKISDNEELCKFSQLRTECVDLIGCLLKEQRPVTLVRRYRDKLDQMLTDADTVGNIVKDLSEVFEEFDFKDVKANGYRTFVAVVVVCVSHCVLCLRTIPEANRFTIKRITHQLLQLSAYLSSITSIGAYVLQLMRTTRLNRSLFMDLRKDPTLYDALLVCHEQVPLWPFYGPLLGLPLGDRCRTFAKTLYSLQVGLAKAAHKPDRDLLLSAFVNVWQHLSAERKRGLLIPDILKQSSIGFYKRMWKLLDRPFLRCASQMFVRRLKVIREISLQPAELELLSAVDVGATVKILPVVDNEHVTVKIRLLSRIRREGMEWTTRNTLTTFAAASNCLLFHIHGGGYISQSSEFHDSYLRRWAFDLDCPIISVNYSHAPEYPYPRAIDECFYAYCYVLKNISQFGCTNDCRIVICGDSAGGNFSLSCTLKAIENRVRLPDGLFLAYPATLNDFVHSPARTLGLIDPLIPVNFLIHCLIAYNGISEENLVCNSSHASSNQSAGSTTHTGGQGFHERGVCDTNGVRMFYSKTDSVAPIRLLETVTFPTEPTMSPLLAGDEILEKLPPLSIVVGQFDPLLDDSIEFCKKAESAGAKFVKLRVIPNLPHAFLNMASPLMKDCTKAMNFCLEEIRNLLVGDIKS